MGKCSRSVPGWESRMASRQARLNRDRQRAAEATAPSDKRAFGAYREATLKRLEDEQRAFNDFLDRLRLAKDRAEFDQFLAERRDRARRVSGDTSASGV